MLSVLEVQLLVKTFRRFLTVLQMSDLSFSEKSFISELTKFRLIHISCQSYPI